MIVRGRRRIKGGLARATCINAVSIHTTGESARNMAGIKESDRQRTGGDRDRHLVPQVQPPGGESFRLPGG